MWVIKGKFLGKEIVYLDGIDWDSNIKLATKFTDEFTARQTLARANVREFFRNPVSVDDLEIMEIK